MQELEKILEEIKSSAVYSETKYGYGAMCVPVGAIERIIQKHMNDGWIPAEERLPERGKTVLVCQRGGAIDVAWHDGYRWKTGFSHADWIRDVIAWRPLPEPYRPERNLKEAGGFGNGKNFSRSD